MAFFFLESELVNEYSLLSLEFLCMRLRNRPSTAGIKSIDKLPKNFKCIFDSIMKCVSEYLLAAVMKLDEIASVSLNTTNVSYTGAVICCQYLVLRNHL